MDIVNNEMPSTCTTSHWVHASNKNKDKPMKGHVNVGKWMIFRDIKDIDEAWIKIKKATEEGELWKSSKAATLYNLQSSGGAYGTRCVICVYTYNWEDEEDVVIIRSKLTELGFTEKLSYKSDEDTYAGKYRHTGHSNISKYRM